LILGSIGAAHADAELLLSDGRVLRGVDVKLEGGFYLIELETGEIAAIPASLVRKVHLLGTRTTEEGTTVGTATDVARPAADQDPISRFVETRPGWQRGDPKDLAGAPWRLHDAQRQTAVLGPPARFQRSPLPFRFKPVHAWDRSINVLAANRSKWQGTSLDPVWKPESAFDHRTDVLAASRSTWPRAPRATSWNPSNSFSRLRADLWWGKDTIPGLDEAPAGHAQLDWRRLTDDCTWCAGVSNRPTVFTEPAAEPLSAEQCARRLFADVLDVETLQWAEIDGAPWDELPYDFHRAWTASGKRAVFSIAGATCRLVSGDLRELIGVDLSETDALAYAVSAWNQLQSSGSPPGHVTPGQQIDHAFALMRLFETATSGHAQARLELLGDHAAVERWLSGGSACSKSASFRMVQRGNVDRNFAVPQAVEQVEWTRVVFWTWLSLDGEVFVYDVRLFADGRVRVSREAIGQHLGEHEDSR
jgi:hypothetical protein